MHEPRHERIQRELFLAAFGANVWAIEPWVTDRLTSILEEQSSRAGETLFSIGDPPDFYYFLREGRVQLVREGHPPWTYDRRSVFGMSDALLERPRARRALALTDIEAMRVQSDAWLELLEDSFPLARAAVMGSVETLAELEQRQWAKGSESRLQQPPSVPSAGELDLVGRLGVLTEAPYLRQAGVQALSDLAATSHAVSFRRGDRLIERGKSGGRVAILLSGEVEASRESPDIVWRWHAGDIVCGVAAFGEPIVAWEAVALSDGRALTFTLADWLDVLEAHFDMVRTTLGALSLRREELLER
jgi:CRP-like cAMP-binding protein